MSDTRRLDEVVAGYTPKPVTVKVCPDGDLVAAFQQATGEDRDRLRAELDDAQVEFRFVGIGRKAWTDLLGQHQPTKEQQKADPKVDHNPETFPQAAIAASMVEPEGASVALIERMFETWPLGECERLWAACLRANHGTNTVPFS